MARTVNATRHMVRRDAFLDVAQRLVQAKGYEAMSIQDVLNELEASKGAFYHYFDSKQALLEAVVERFADVAIADLAPLLDDPNVPALRKLETFFKGIAEGVFHVASPDETATVFISLMLGFQELANDYFIGRQAGTITFAVVQRSVASFTEAFERILGIPKGSLTLTDESTLHFWFG